MKQLFIFLLFLIASCSSPNNDKAIGQGVINGFVDGEYIPKVNLWSSVHAERRQINEALPDAALVDILDINGDYYYVRSKSDKRIYGYCMKGFVSDLEWYKKPQ